MRVRISANGLKVWITLALLMAGMAIAAPTNCLALDKQLLIIDPAPMQGTMSVHTTFQTSSSWVPADGTDDAVILAGLATAPNAAQAALTLSWSCNVSGWFPRWVIKLTGENGWRPKLLLPGDKEKTADQTGSVELTTAVPVGGHAYDVTFSFAGSTGAGTLSIVDSTAGKPVYSGSFQAAKTNQALYPLIGAAGELLDTTAGLKQSIASVGNIYEPAGTLWQLCSEDDVSCRGNLLFNPGEPLNLVLSAPAGPLTGVYRIWATSADTRVLLAEILAKPMASIRYTLAPLPVGRCLVTAEYVQGEQVIWTDSRSVTNGMVELTSSDLYVDRVQGKISGAFYIRGADSLPAIPLVVRATIQRLMWNPASRSYDAQPYQTLEIYNSSVLPVPHPEGITFNFPLPAEEGLYAVILDATSPIGVLVRSVGQNLLFNTFSPAEVIIEIGS